MPIFWFELRYRLKRPATYIYALLFFAMGALIMSTEAVQIGGGYGKVNSNAPFNIHQILSIMGVFGLFIVMAFHSVPIYRDVEHKVDQFLYTYPFSKNQYLGGRFIGTFFLCSVVYFFLPLGMMAGEGIDRVLHPDSADWGPFSIMGYLWPFLICCIPTIFLLGSMFFSLVALTRKVMGAYLIAIGFIVLYSIGLNMLSDLDNKDIAALTDPFGLLASDRLTEYWSIAQKNKNLVPLEGVFLFNRIIWLLLGIGFLCTCFLRFKMTPVQDSVKTKTDKKEVVKPLIPSNLSSLAKPQFSSIKSFFALFAIEVRQNLRNVFFLTFLFAIVVFLAFNGWNADRTYETGIYPVTRTVLESATSGMFSILTMTLLIFLAGEIVWRERQNQMEGIYNAFPVSNRTIFLAKYTSLLLVPVILLTLVALVGVCIQLLKGYLHLEPELYFKTLIIFELPRFFLLATLAFCIQVIVNNKFVGHSAILIYYLSFIGLSYLKVEHPLFRFASGMSYRYSDMNGFGESVRSIRMYLLHWTLVSGLLLALAYLLMVRGSEASLKIRKKLAFNRFSNSIQLKSFVSICVIGMLSTGFYIYYQTVVIDRFTNSRKEEEISAEYEKKFEYLERSLHPMLTDVKIGADMYPESNELRLTGKFTYKNPHIKAIDTLWFNVNPDQEIKKFDLNVSHQKAYEDTRKGIYAYLLKPALAPGDSFLLDVDLKIGFTGLANESPVRGNGTFFNNGEWPYMGYNKTFQIQDEDKRKEYGLAEMPTMDSQTDSVAIQKSLFDQLNHSIRFEATLSTSPDQIAIAPGYLTKEWTENGRRYFHYKMDRPISNFYSIISARYASYSEKWNDVDITIYHHPAHDFNVKKMAEAVRHSLDYYSTNFSPYQHKQVRILEFPRYQSFAQSFDNTIPYSEGIGFVANLEEEGAIDYVYFVTAHEMAHQWWGHQINPAFVRGGQFLSETMAEYSALMVMKKRYGEELMGRFLGRELNDYLSGRSSERKKENPLLDIEMQSYAYYNKGSLAMYQVMDLLGEAKMNEFLKTFVSTFQFKQCPYPTTLNYYNLLIKDLNPEKVRQVDDQLKRITLYNHRITEAKGRKLGNGEFEVRFNVELEKMYADSLGTETKAAFTDPITVGLLEVEKPLKKSDIAFMEKRTLKSGDEVVVKTKTKVKFASIDPLHFFTDIRTEDNFKIISWE